MENRRSEKLHCHYWRPEGNFFQIIFPNTTYIQSFFRDIQNCCLAFNAITICLTTLCHEAWLRTKILIMRVKISTGFVTSTFGFPMRMMEWFEVELLKTLHLSLTPMCRCVFSSCTKGSRQGAWPSSPTGSLSTSACTKRSYTSKLLHCVTMLLPTDLSVNLTDI